MADESLFLDTNVYLGYVQDGYFERFHQDCCHVFDKLDHPLHTSLTVRQELNKKSGEKRRLFRILLEYCLSGRQLKDFGIKQLDKNEQSYALKIAQAHKEGKSDLEYIKGLRRMFFSRLQYCLQKTQQPFVPYSQDAYMKSDFALIGIHYPDDSVLADFFSWALPGPSCSFVTCEYRLANLREKIIQSVEEGKQSRCSHLSVTHITEIQQKYPQ